MTLYHYTSGQALYEIINSSELHCSNIKFLNDPSEQVYFKEILETVLNKKTECKEIHETLFNESYQSAVLDPGEKFVASFSKNSDSLSMWNYYSKGNGYNIGLDINSIERMHQNDIAIKRIELIYDKDLQLNQTEQYILGFKSDLEKYLKLEFAKRTADTEDEYHKNDHEQDAIIDSYNNGLFEMSLTYKHQAYEREEEVRLIISIHPMDEIQLGYKVSKNGTFVEYYPLKLALKDQLKSLTIHPINNELQLNGVDRFIKSTVGYNKVTINLSKIPFREI